jgi:glycosyltransferase involved in cell wall biosynthesis
MYAYFIACLVAVGCHRLWNYEDVFAQARAWLQRKQARLRGAGWVLTPVMCPACNAFWIPVIVASIFYAAGCLERWQALSLPFAVYAGIRALVWVYQQPWHALFQPHQCGRHAPPAQPPTPAPGTQSAPTPPNPPPKQQATSPLGCSSCAKTAEEMKSDRAFTDTFKQRVVLMTALADWHPSYSLVSVILDQARALAQEPTRLVQIWVMQSANLANAPKDLPKNVQIKPFIPDTVWREDVIDDAAVAKLNQHLMLRLFNLGNATIITHDLMFVTWYATFAAALHKIGVIRAFSWIHQIHSCVGAKPAETPATKVRTTLPPGHLLAVVNATEAEPAAAYYGIEKSRVVVIPNVCDIRSWGVSEAARSVLLQSRLAEADVSQLYPLSLPRAEAKGLHHVINTHLALRKAGHSTELVVADAHANTAEAVQLKQKYLQMAGGEGLRFVSNILPNLASDGIDAATVRQLFSATNVFIFPSLSESAGLVALEAAAAGVYPWVNSNVPALYDLAASEHNDIRAWPFPSQRAPMTEPVDYQGLANEIINIALQDKHSIRRRRSFRANSTSALSESLSKAVEAAKPIP